MVKMRVRYDCDGHFFVFQQSRHSLTHSCSLDVRAVLVHVMGERDAEKFIFFKLFSRAKIKTH